MRKLVLMVVALLIPASLSTRRRAARSQRSGSAPRGIDDPLPLATPDHIYVSSNSSARQSARAAGMK